MKNYSFYQFLITLPPPHHHKPPLPQHIFHHLPFPKHHHHFNILSHYIHTHPHFTFPISVFHN
ncbi:YozE family protein, partial [Staphylococcus aureus]|uniref:YozE family protein n=1 Tax=Staphylococcus aureus TaxID=1280 RepID=UPI0011A24C2E